MRPASLRHLTLVSLASLLLIASAVASQPKSIHNFAENLMGCEPSALLMDPSGNLFGLAGDPNFDPNCGMIFELQPQSDGSWKFQVLHQLGKYSTLSQQAPFARDAKGNLFATTVSNLDGKDPQSAIVELSPMANGKWSYQTIYTFGAGDGSLPSWLIVDASGNLYGTTTLGGNGNSGIVCELSPGSGGWIYTALYSFPCATCADGSDDPPDPPVFDAEGNLYGTTTEGGINTPPCYDQNGCGVIFRLMHNSDGTWTYEVLHRFGSYPTDGLSPYGSLVMDASGNFYGTTFGGGKYGWGTIFKLSFEGGSWQKTDLFDAPDLLSSGPVGNLAFDQAGNLYGVADGGLQLCGGFSCSLAFKLTRKGDNQWEYSALHLFTGRQDGFGPLGVVVDTNGNVFGTTATGGLYFSGVAFEIMQ